MYKINSLPLLIVILSLWNSEILAQEIGNTFREDYQYHIKRTSESIKIDGVIDEAWQPFVMGSRLI